MAIENILNDLAKLYALASTTEEKLRIDEQAIEYIQDKSHMESLSTRYYELYYELKSKYIKVNKLG